MKHSLLSTGGKLDLKEAIVQSLGERLFLSARDVQYMVRVTTTVRFPYVLTLGLVPTSTSSTLLSTPIILLVYSSVASRCLKSKEGSVAESSLPLEVSSLPLLAVPHPTEFLQSLPLFAFVIGLVYLPSSRVVNSADFSSITLVKDRKDV